MNAKMPELKRCFESAGFSEVRTLLSSGNVVFNARSGSPKSLERRIEETMNAELDRVFLTIVRPIAHLQGVIDSDPYADFKLAATAKRVVTFLRHPAKTRVELPIERDGASVLKMTATEAFSAYIPNEKGPAFMSVLERTFGKDITTRTLDTVRKCARA